MNTKKAKEIVKKEIDVKEQKKDKQASKDLTRPKVIKPMQ